MSITRRQIAPLLLAMYLRHYVDVGARVFGPGFSILADVLLYGVPAAAAAVLFGLSRSRWDALRAEAERPLMA